MPKKSEGGWSGIGTANSGIDPTHVYFLNDHPTQIPPSEMLGPVVQNCQQSPGPDMENVPRNFVLVQTRKRLAKMLSWDQALTNFPPQALAWSKII